ncbi:transposase, partial [Staphylococcus canis]
LENVALPDIHPKLRTVIKTLKSYIPFITNTLEYANFTNGPIEDINNQIKLTKRVSFVYKNYETIHNRIILSLKLFASEKKGS